MKQISITLLQSCDTHIQRCNFLHLCICNYFMAFYHTDHLCHKYCFSILLNVSWIRQNLPCFSYQFDISCSPFMLHIQKCNNCVPFYISTEPSLIICCAQLLNELNQPSDRKMDLPWMKWETWVEMQISILYICKFRWKFNISWPPFPVFSVVSISFSNCCHLTKR